MLARQRVESLVRPHRPGLGDDVRRLVPRVGRDEVGRLTQRPADDVHAGGVVAGDVEAVQHALGVQQRGTAAGHDALGHRGPGGGQRVLDPVLQFLELGVRRGAHPDHGYLAGQRADPLVQHVLVDAEGGPLQLGPHLVEPELDRVLGAGAVDDRGVIGVDPHLGGPAELVDRHRLQGEPRVLAVHVASGQRGDVLQLAQPAVTEPGRPHRDALEDPVHVVVYEEAQRGALDVLRDQDQRAGRPHDLVEDRHQLLHLGDLLAAQQDVGIVDDRLEGRRVGHHVRRQVAVVELEALDEVDGHPRRRLLFHGDDAAVAHGEQGLGDHGAHRVVVVGRDRGDPGVVLLGLYRVRDAVQVLDQAADGQIDAPLDQHRVATLSDGFHARPDDRLGEHRGRGGAVAHDVVGLDGGFLDQLRAHVLELVLQVDFPRDRHAVVGDHGRAGDLLQDDVAPLGAESRLDGLGQLVYASQQQAASFSAEAQFLGHE